MKSIFISAAILAVTLSLPAQILTITDVKALGNNTPIVGTTTGTVVQVGGSTNRRQFVIADSNSNGIIVDNAGSSTYTQPLIGDIVQLNGGNKSIFNNSHQYQTTVTTLNILSSSNPLPTPKVYTLAQLLARTSPETGDYIRVNGVRLTTPLPSIGDNGTFWLDGTATAGNANFIITDGTNSVTLRFPTDLAGALTTYQAKPIPTLNVEQFDIIGTISVFSGVYQIQVGSPAGTTAKFDAAGPFIQGVVAAGVSDWSIYE